jgi:ubiquinone/menaquinone biosynthesis C-methylase UbiE
VVELIEGNTISPGRALDLGCGTGTNAIYLARHGWTVVGVDYALLAIRQARRRARREGVDCCFHRADVTNMPFLPQPFTFALDIGCLHSVAPERRATYAAEIRRLVLPGGLYVLYSFFPCDGALRRGITPQDVRRLFVPSFAIERQEGGEDPNGPSSAWYWLRRSGDSPTAED